MSMTMTTLAQQGRLFTSFFDRNNENDVDSPYVVVNKTLMAYGAGAMLATGFLTAAVLVNLFEAEAKAEAETEVTTSAPSAVNDSDLDQATAKTDHSLLCDCDVYCYDHYLSHFYPAEPLRRRRKKRFES